MNQIKINIKSESLNEIKEIIDMTNKFNTFKYPNKEEITIEDFIKASIKNEMNRCKEYYQLVQKVFNPKETFNNNFFNMTKDAGYTQTFISEQTGINQASLSKILKNQTQLRIDSFFKLWVFFGCPPLEKCIDFVGDN
jgi:hypothetical protein